MTLTELHEMTVSPIVFERDSFGSFDDYVFAFMLQAVLEADEARDWPTRHGHILRLLHYAHRRGIGIEFYGFPPEVLAELGLPVHPKRRRFFRVPLAGPQARMPLDLTTGNAKAYIEKLKSGPRTPASD